MNNTYLIPLKYCAFYLLLLVAYSLEAQIKTSEVTVENRDNTLIQASGNTVLDVEENLVTFEKLAVFNEGLKLPPGSDLNGNPVGQKLFWGWNNGPFISSVIESGDTDVQGLVFYTHRTGTHADPPEESLRLSAWGNLMMRSGVLSSNLEGRKIQWGDLGPYMAPILTGADGDQLGLVFYTHESSIQNDPPTEAMRLSAWGDVRFKGGFHPDSKIGRKVQWGSSGPYIAPILTGPDDDQLGLVFYTHESNLQDAPPTEAMRISAWGNVLYKKGVASGNKIGRKIQWGENGPYMAPIRTGGDDDQLGLVFYTHPSGLGDAAPAEAMRIKHDGTFQFNASNTLGGFGTKLQWDYHNGPFISSVALAGDPDSQGLSFWVHPSQTYSHAPIEAMRIGLNGNVGIGSAPTVSYKLAVDGDIASTGDLRANVTNWPDYVFAEDYMLPSLEEVDAFIQKEHHLPSIPSEKEVLENGIKVAEMNAKLLQKIEEMTLYMIDMNDRLKQLEKENEHLKRAMKE